MPQSFKLPSPKKVFAELKMPHYALLHKQKGVCRNAKNEKGNFIMESDERKAFKIRRTNFESLYLEKKKKL
jgi:hypothetical protein